MKMIQRALRHFCLGMVHRISPDGVRFAQVGANDGKLADPILRFIETGAWQGVMIEPHPAYFADLSELHRGKAGIQLVNCAVSNAEGQMQLFHLSEAEHGAYPSWARGCASLKHNRLVEVLTGKRKDGKPSDLDAEIEAVTVPVRRLDAILADAGLSKLDFLIVDVEGFELNVLDSVDLGVLGLRACLVECNGTDIGNEARIAHRLVSAGLVTFRLDEDLFGAHPDLLRFGLRNRFSIGLPTLLQALGQKPIVAAI